MPCYEPVPRDVDDILSAIVILFPILYDIDIYEQLSVRLELVNFKASIIYTDSPSAEYIVECDNTCATDPSTDDYNRNESDDDYNRLLDQVYEVYVWVDIDLDKFLVSAAHDRGLKWFYYYHISKVWGIHLRQLNALYLLLCNTVRNIMTPSYQETMVPTISCRTNKFMDYLLCILSLPQINSDICPKFTPIVKYL